MAKNPENQRYTTNTSKKHAGLFLASPSESGPFEQDNRFPGVLNNPEHERAGMVGELQAYLDSPDTSLYSDIGEREVMAKVHEAILKQHYRTALAILFSEDIKMTHQVSLLALRLNRVDQIANRELTTDVMDFSQAKTDLKNHEDELVKYYGSDDPEQAQLILRNVENAHFGTTEQGLDELEKSRNMVQRALKQLFKNQFQTVMPPHKVEGQEASGLKNQAYVRTDDTAKITEYLRLFSALTVEIIKQKQNTPETGIPLSLERQSALQDFEALQYFPGIKVSYKTRQKLLDSISIMDLEQIDYFNFTVKELHTKLKREEIKPEIANLEIQSWQDKSFTKRELHLDHQKRVAANRQTDNEQLADLRSAA